MAKSMKINKKYPYRNCFSWVVRTSSCSRSGINQFPAIFDTGIWEFLRLPSSSWRHVDPYLLIILIPRTRTKLKVWSGGVSRSSSSFSYFCLVAEYTRARSCIFQGKILVTVNLNTLLVILIRHWPYWPITNHCCVIIKN